MQPRWRDSADVILDSSGGKPFCNDILKGLGRATSGTAIITSYNGLSYQKQTPVNDTSKVIMLVSDTSNQNGFRSSRCWWMEGYETMCSRLEKLSGSTCLDENDKPTTDCWVEIVETCYLDQSKVTLKKNFIVWMSKPIK